MNKTEVKEIIKLLDAHRDSGSSMKSRVDFLHSMVRLSEQSANLDGQKKEMNILFKKMKTVLA